MGNQESEEGIHATPGQLQAVNVPISTADCRHCADPCDEGHEEFPSRFDVDRETQLFGTIKPYRRQVVISTGKSDWAREVTEDSGTLAAYLNSISSKSKGPKAEGGQREEGEKKKNKNDASSPIFRATEQSKISILNGSHHSLSNEADTETVLVFPDFKVVSEVKNSVEGAQKLWNVAIDPKVGRAGRDEEAAEEEEKEGESALSGSTLRSWVLPYAAVILLCSHKKRDNRCSIAAPKLEHGFTVSLERSGWEVHTQLDDPSDYSPAIEDIKGTKEQKEAEILNILKSFDSQHATTKRALILKNSHIGGHKYAGNVIIYTPQGVAVWYGRVTPHVVDAIVEETIIGGKVLPPLLRGGINLSQPNHQSLNEW
ncbi:Thioredoxin-like ferredoxin [Abortiporus biennis]